MTNEQEEQRRRILFNFPLRMPLFAAFLFKPAGQRSGATAIRMVMYVSVTSRAAKSN